MFGFLKRLFRRRKNTQDYHWGQIIAQADEAIRKDQERLLYKSWADLAVFDELDAYSYASAGKKGAEAGKCLVEIAEKMWALPRTTDAIVMTEKQFEEVKCELVECNPPVSLDCRFSQINGIPIYREPTAGHARARVIKLVAEGKKVVLITDEQMTSDVALPVNGMEITKVQWE